MVIKDSDTSDPVRGRERRSTEMKGTMRPSMAAPAAKPTPTAKPAKAASTGEKAKREFAQVNPTNLFNSDGNIRLVTVQLTDRDGKPKLDDAGKPRTRLQPARMRRTDFTAGADGRKAYFTYLGKFYLWRAENGPRAAVTEEEKLQRKQNALLEKLEAVRKQKAELEAKKAAAAK